MQDNNEKLYLKKHSIRFLMTLRISVVVLIVLWLIFFLTLKALGGDLPRRVDIAILASVMLVCAILAITDDVYARRNCRCPYCGCKWSFFKYRPFSKGPLDVFNDDKEYICYKCNSKIDIL